MRSRGPAANRFITPGIPADSRRNGPRNLGERATAMGGTLKLGPPPVVAVAR